MKNPTIVLMAMALLGGPLGCSKGSAPYAPMASSLTPIVPQVVASWTSLAVNDPRGLAMNPSTGDLYVANGGTNQILRFASDGSLTGQWGSEGTGEGQFQEPYGLARASNGDIYVADFGNGRVQKLDPNGNYVGIVGDAGSFTRPADVLIDPTQNVYVTDGINIKGFTSGNAPMSTWGSGGSFDNQFTFPVGLTMDMDGNFYTVDYLQHQAVKLNPGSSTSSTWGSLGTAAGQFKNPTDIKYDGAGNLYVADFGNNRIQQFDVNGTFIREWGQADLVNPMYMVIDSGYLYVTDNGHNRVVKYQL